VSAVRDLSVGDLVDQIAATDEPIASGAAAAIVCAEAAALLNLTAALALNHRPEDGALQSVAAAAKGLRDAALDTAELERTAYRDALAAGDLGAAADAPLRTAQLAASVASGAAVLVGAGEWPFTPDAVAAVVMADCAATVAATLVRANLVEVPDDPRLTIAADALAATQSAMKLVEGR